MIVKQNSYFASVELHGWFTRGQMVLDHLNTTKPNVKVIEKVNDEFFKRLLLKAAKMQTL